MLLGSFLISSTDQKFQDWGYSLVFHKSHPGPVRSPVAKVVNCK